MGSEIVFVFGPLCLMAIFALGYIASKPGFRIPAGLCATLSAVVSLNAVDIVPSYSFWTQAGFYGFVFVATALVALPIMLFLSRLVRRQSST